MIRLATLEDADRLAELEILLFPDNCLNEFSVRKELLAGRCWVIGDPIMAYALVRVDSRLSDLLRLGVVPEHQGQGHGKSLLRHVISECPGDLMLQVQQDNERAWSLYRKHGFHVSTITEGVWFMRRCARSNRRKG
jgi:ribosomal protein S18 acetylase RimI-like enzyme